MEIEIVKIVLNAGVMGAIAILLWMRLVKITDFYFEELKAMSAKHRAEIAKMESDYRAIFLHNEERLEELTEKAIESMVRVELIAQAIMELLHKDK